MYRVYQILTPLIALAFFSGCNMEVKKAHAPTNPPKVRKGNFKAQQIKGAYRAGTTVMFMWPQDRWDSQSETFVPLSLDEKAESRKTIVRLSEEKAFYEAEYKKQEPIVIEKYRVLKATLVSSYKENKCYSLCDPMDFACEPDNPESYPQYTWKEPENEQEAEVIASCQQNQAEQENIENKQTEELQKLVMPAKIAAQGLLAAVGDRNFFSGLNAFELKYGALQSCFVDDTSECLRIESGELGLMVKLKFSNSQGDEFLFSNAEDAKVGYPVSDVVLDEENGFLSFNIPAVDFENGNKKYGEIRFDLEMNPRGDSLSIEGDFRLDNFETNLVRVGRFSSSGRLTPLEQQSH